jgi:hypothetical protein
MKAGNKNAFLVTLKDEFASVASADARLQPLMQVLARHGIRPARGEAAMDLLKKDARERGFFEGLGTRAEFNIFVWANSQNMATGQVDQRDCLLAFVCEDGKAKDVFYDIRLEKSCRAVIDHVSVKAPDGNKTTWQPK